MPLNLLAIDSVILFCVLAIVLRIILTKRKLLPLPPGPKPWPLIGNVSGFPTTHEGRFYLQHKHAYGPISSISSMSTTVIIINDLDIAVDLLEKRSSTTSDRCLPEFGKFVGIGLATSLLPYGPDLKHHRKLIQGYMNTRATVDRIEKAEEIEARRLLVRLMHQPQAFLQHVRTYPGAVILKISHGYTISPDGNDTLIQLAEKALDEVAHKTMTPGKWVVDNYPFLKYAPEWLPGMSFKKLEREWREIMHNFYDTPFKFVKKQIASGKAPPSYVSHYIEEGEAGDKYQEDALKYSAASIFAGGADSSAAALKHFFRAMALHPDVVSRAQEELDCVIGKDRLPTFRDREKLPYINAIIKEVLRWDAIAPTGIAHLAMNEDTYAGYRIPKGAVLIPNIWGMCRDPQIYADPEVFDPGRFLKQTPELDPMSFVFGFGRRVCPGKKLADSSLFISTSMILATFDIGKAQDQDGRIIEPDCVYRPGTVSHPTPFRCSITPRSALAMELILSVLDEHPFKAGDGDVLNSL